MKVQFLDLKAQFSDIQQEVMDGVYEVLQSGEFVLGSAVDEFEQNFSHFLFSEDEGLATSIQEAIDLRLEYMYKHHHCVGVGNGTDSLEVAFKALGFAPKSEIIIPANTYFACAEAALNAGLHVLIADCQEDGGFSLDESMLSPNTRAILAVHLYGKILPLDAFEAFATKHNLKLIEDCSQAHGGKDSLNRNVGSVGDIGCFSFYPAKNLGAYGDGGAIVSKDLQLLKKAREIANHGQEFIHSQWHKNYHIAIGQNSRLDSLQAKILTIKLKSLLAHNSYRERCAREYRNHLAKFDFLKLPDVDAKSVWHLFVVECCGKAENKRDSLLEFLKDNQIECGVHYPNALSDIKVLQQDSRVRILPTPNASHRAKNILSLPIGEHLGVDEITYITQVIEQWANECL